MADLEIFLSVAPGLESVLLEEVRAAGFDDPVATPGGVTIRGDWPEVWRANLVLRGPARVLVRIASFRAMHLAQLDKRLRKLDWAAILRPDKPVRVEATCRASRIYHDRAAAERVKRALREELGVTISPEAEIRVMARIEDDLCTISLDTSGAPLHKRGFKQAVVKAPMRETLAALFLRRCGYRGEECVVDPMCGSGTFLLEAAEIAAGLHPGRGRDFAFEQFATFDAAVFDSLRTGAAPCETPRFYGYDRDPGAVKATRANAERAGVASLISVEQAPVSALSPPEGAAPGLVIVNPPYGGRIGQPGPLRALYGSLGAVLKERFSGWRVGIITSDEGLARITELPFLPLDPVVAHGSLKVRLYRTDPL